MCIYKQKINSIPQLFYRYYTLMNIVTWLAKNILHLQSKKTSRHEIFNGKSRIKRIYILHCFQEKEITKFSKKKEECETAYFWAALPKFGQKWVFWKNRDSSLFRIYSCLTWCKNSEKTNKPISGKSLNKRTYERMNKRTNKWIHGKTNKLTQVKL